MPPPPRVICEEGHAGNVYELAGDDAGHYASWRMNLLIRAEKIVYQNLSEVDFAAALKGAGLPDGLADMLANSDAGAAKGGLFDDSHTLRKLIGRPTTTLTESLRSVL